jgi:hypothetical protein
MSGQPTKKPTDIQAFRNAYLDTLGLQASINAENLEANKVYKATGSLPPKSTITDTRSTSEILADIEGLKISLIQTLKPLFDPSTASQVLQRIQRSPLNADGSLFTFFAQRADEFVAQLQRMYKYGIKGDENDIEQFVAFLEKSFSSTKNMSSSVRGYFDSKDPNKSGISKGEIDKYNAGILDFRNNLVSNIFKTLENLQDRTSNKMIAMINQILEAHLEFVNSQKYLAVQNDFTKVIEEKEIDYGELKFVIADVYQMYQDYMKDLPSTLILDTLSQQLQKSLINKDKDLTHQILQNILDVLPSLSSIEKLEKYFEAIPEERAEQINPPRRQQPAILALPMREQPPPQPLRREGVPPPPAGELPRRRTEEEINQAVQDLQDHLFTVAMELIGIETADDEEELNNIIEIVSDEYITNSRAGMSHEEAKQEALDMAVDNLNQSFGVEIPRERIGYGLKGKPKKRRGRPKGSGIKKTFDDYKDSSMGVKSKTPFISFGKHFINSNKLQDGVISLRHKSGAGLPNFPSRKVSNNLTSIIKTIVGGGMPSYNDVDKLTDEEKNYLHQISKKSDLTQMLAIPAPSKDKMEKDFNQFEIMKGEIMAGNDSKELIKKFKVLLLKLVNTGQLPKAQVQEIMTELLEMGY